MSFPYVSAFLILLLAYMIYSEWARLDSRYPIAAALALLVATAIVDAAGAVAAANTLAEYVFFLLAGGVVLLLVDHMREGRAVPGAGGAAGSAPSVPGESEAAEAAEERQGPADEPFDSAE